MDGQGDVPLVERVAAAPPALGEDDGHDRRLQLLLDGRAIKQSMGDQFAQHGRVLVGGADRRRHGAPESGRVLEELDPVPRRAEPTSTFGEQPQAGGTLAQGAELVDIRLRPGSTRPIPPAEALDAFAHDRWRKIAALSQLDAVAAHVQQPADGPDDCAEVFGLFGRLVEPVVKSDPAIEA